MKKYRIIEHAGYFTIERQVSYLFGLIKIWWVTGDEECGAFSEHNFSSIKEAEKTIKRWNKESKIIKEICVD